MKLLNSFILLLFIALLSSCNDKEDGDVEGVILTVSPTSPVIIKNENDKIEFIIKIASGNSIVKIEVTEEGENEIDSEVIFSETPNTTSYDGFLKFFVKVPPTGNAYYKYTFTATDSDGTKSIVTRKIYISETPLLSKETINLFSAISDDELSGYDLNSKTVVTGEYTSALSFYDATDTTGNSEDNLSKKWIGANSTSFVKNNSFKFDDASYNSIQATFEASTASDSVTNIAKDDILLVKYKNGLTNKYALIKILVVNDKLESNEDVYIFNLKYQ